MGAPRPVLHCGPTTLSEIPRVVRLRGCRPTGAIGIEEKKAAGGLFFFDRLPFGVRKFLPRERRSPTNFRLR